MINYLHTFILMIALSVIIGCNNNKQMKNTAEDFYIRIDNAKAQELIKNEKDLVLLDVRTPEETAEGVIGEPVIIDFLAGGFETKVQDLDKDATYLVYCRSGNRSAKASHIMKDQGFKKVYELETGYSNWK